MQKVWSLMLHERDGRAQPGATRRPNAGRLGASSDLVLAAITAFMTLHLKTPEHATLVALAKLWPTALS
jgi:hypothetical protein